MSRYLILPSGEVVHRTSGADSVVLPSGSLLSEESTPFDAQAKRMCALSEDWAEIMVFPVATPTEAWRASVVGVYCGNALSPPVGGANPKGPLGMPLVGPFGGPI